MSASEREAQLTAWAVKAMARHDVTADSNFRLVSASVDASFRRYFRGRVGPTSYIFVDAPPELEDSRPFVDVAGRLAQAGLSAPKVYEADLTQGFMMLSDLGDELYLTAVESGDDALVERLYGDALAALVTMQRVPASDLPDYDERLLREEMDLFPDWFCAGQLQIELDERERAQLEEVFALMVDNARAQPWAFVHRDYHSRNLMVIPRGNPGILDFQDAVRGPVTYDLASLLRDCYLRFPRERVYRWVASARDDLVAAGLLDTSVSVATFRQWFDLMGLQRHLKCAGIFSRLHLRDGKPRYLADIPLVVSYILDVCREYEMLHEFADWLDRRIVTLMRERPEFGMGE